MCCAVSGFTRRPILDEVVQLPERSVSRQRLQVGEQILLLGLEQLPVHVEAKRLVPERPDVDPGDLGGGQHLAQRPHEGAVDSHQLLVVYAVGFVQDDSENN